MPFLPSGQSFIAMRTWSFEFFWGMISTLPSCGRRKENSL
jgi:hypothetical protein